MNLPPTLAVLPIVLTMLLPGSASAADEMSFYVGTYTDKGSKGIYSYRLNLETGAVTGGDLAAEAKSPSFLAVHPEKKFLYAVNEAGGGGGVSAFAVQPDGKLKLLNEQSAGGAGPCHIAVDRAGKYAFVANYGGGSVSALPIKEDGSLGEATGFVQHTGSGADPKRQKAPHAHSIYPDPTNQRIYACDLGLDKVLIYQLDASGKLVPNVPPSASVAPGAGPRHLAFEPKTNHCYVINEMLSTITVFSQKPDGALEELQTLSTLPEGYTGNNSTAEIFVHPNGKFVYGSNRGHNSIAVYAIGDRGTLKLVQHESTKGKAPRNFGIDPSGKWLLAANQDTNNVFVFRIDEATGKITPTEHSFELGSPVCVTFVR